MMMERLYTKHKLLTKQHKVGENHSFKPDQEKIGRLQGKYENINQGR